SDGYIRRSVYAYVVTGKSGFCIAPENTQTVMLPQRQQAFWGRLRERAKSYAKALANDILR
ncbi:TPA: hypothetical protein ACWYJ4_005630, partial [Escherichia coli]